MEMTMWDFIYEMREIIIVGAIGFTIVFALVLSIIRVLIEEVVYCRRAGIAAHITACDQMCQCQKDNVEELAAQEILNQAKSKKKPRKNVEIMNVVQAQG